MVLTRCHGCASARAGLWLTFDTITHDETLLAAVTLGLWPNLAGEWLKPEPVPAQDARTLPELETIGQSLRSIEREL